MTLSVFCSLSISLVYAQNVVTATQSLLQHFEKEQLSDEVRSAWETAQQFIESREYPYEMTQDMTSAITVLWADKGVHHAFAHRNSEAHSQLSHFVARCRGQNALHHADYVPTEQDILRWYVHTTVGFSADRFTFVAHLTTQHMNLLICGYIRSELIAQHGPVRHFEIEIVTLVMHSIGRMLKNLNAIQGHRRWWNNQFKVIDVGGRRNERRKWVHCFEYVTCVIFVASMSEYNQALWQDVTTNRVVESLNLFDEICNTPLLQYRPLILFLNKCDLFRDKIATVPLTVCESFADFEGAPHSYEQGCAYFIKTFQARNRFHREIHTHITCAIDTNGIMKIFDAVKDVFLKRPHQLGTSSVRATDKYCSEARQLDEYM